MSKLSAPKTFRIPLGTERKPELGNGLRITSDFIQLVFNRGTDKDCHVDVLINENDGNEPERFFNRDSLKAGSKNGSPVKIDGCVIYNDLQVGKELYVTVHTDTTHENGSLISDAEVEEILPTSGTDSLIGITTGGVVQVATALDLTCRGVVFENRLGFDCYIKFNNDNNKTGRFLPNGQSLPSFHRGTHYVLCDSAVVANNLTGVGLNITKVF